MRNTKQKTVALLGSTGSVGVNTLQVIEQHPKHFKVVGLAAGSNWELLKRQTERFAPSAVYLDEADSIKNLKSDGKNQKPKFFSKKEGLRTFAAYLDADILMVATSGTLALHAVLDALKKGKRVALANKEILVMAGDLIMRVLKENPQSSLIPVDSEHNAIFQCLEKDVIENVQKIYLTSSGGPLRQVQKKEFATLTKEMVVNHPKWRMGHKISVDSATMMYKGLEGIEASCLFGLPVEQIEVLVHPEAVIHSMVEFKDGAVLAQLGVTDMRLPIQYALSYPARLQVNADRRLDFAKLSQLTFHEPDKDKFPCLGIAYTAAKNAGSEPCVLSAADEVAVHAFLNDKIKFIEIPKVVEKVLSRHSRIHKPDLAQIESAHSWAIEETKKLCQAH